MQLSRLLGLRVIPVGSDQVKLRSGYTRYSAALTSPD